MVIKNQILKEFEALKDKIKKKQQRSLILTDPKFFNFLKNIGKDKYIFKKRNLDIINFDTINVYLFKKMNTEYKTFIHNMSDDNIIYENENIIPTVFKYYIDDKKIKPFWSDKIAQLSKNIFLPIEENLRDLNEVEKKQYITLKNTWFHSIIKLNKNKNEHDKIKFEKNISHETEIKKCIKIKLFLTKEQRKVVNILIGTYRYFYNRVIQCLNNFNKNSRTSWFLMDNKDKKSIINIDFNDTKTIIKKDKNGIETKQEIKSNIYNFYDLRPKLKKDKPKWMMDDYPSHLIDQAIKEALDRIKTNFSVGNKFKMRFKTKKELTQTINLEKEMINKNKNTIFTNLKYENKKIFEKINTSEQFNKYDYIGSTLTYHRILKTYFLNLSINGKINETKKEKICAIDLGVNIFATVFSENSVEQLGIDVKDKLHKLCVEIDIINSLMTKKIYKDKKKNKIFNLNSQRKRNLQKAKHRKIMKIKNLKNELHWKIINYLTETYSQIIISPFETQNMVKTLKSEYARKMNNLSFYEFKLKLQSKCKEKGVGLLIKSECYTSITCTCCGHINSNGFIGRTYICKKCGNKINRDYQGARNIFLKNIMFFILNGSYKNIKSNFYPCHDQIDMVSQKNA